jgi:carboxyl-terminal processing protease
VTPAAPTLRAAPGDLLQNRAIPASAPSQSYLGPTRNLGVLQSPQADESMQRRQIWPATISITLGLAACTPEDPFYVEPPAECDVESQNQFVVDVMRDYYLWNADLPTDVDIAAYETPESLVSDLRVGDDRWTRIRDAATSDALFMEGKYVGLGYKTQRGAENEVRLSFVSDNSPASGAGLLRGDVILGVNGYSVAQLDENDSWGEVYGPEEPGVQVAIEVERLASGTVETVMLTKEWIDIVSLPVMSVLDAGGTPVGYFVMDKFVETTKAELDTAFTMFKDAGASTVIIDLRYNGGGLISVAERLVSLALGADHAGSTAYSFEYNSNYASENSSTDISELDASIGADDIIVLTSSRTLSASELVINALFPYANVTLIGSTTGGKPVGSKSFEFCEKKLFPITFRLVNADGNTDYFDGLPADCWAEDDLFHQLGDTEEGMLAAAIAFLGDGTCEPMPSMPAPPAPLGIQKPVDAVGERVLPNEEWRDEIDSW